VYGIEMVTVHGLDNGGKLDTGHPA
jgi:hypothetical protein